MGLLDFAGGLFNSITSNRTAKKNAKLQYQTAIDSINLQTAANRELMEKNNAFNLEMWNRQNEYNSPKNQMQRYEAAGINPALVGIQGNPGNASGAPQASEIVTDYSNYKSGPEKVAFKLEGISNLIENVVGFISNLQDLKRKELDNEDRSFRNNFSRAFYEGRANYNSRKSLLMLQDYFLKGGDVTSEESAKIRKFRLEKLPLENEYLAASISDKLWSANNREKLSALRDLQANMNLYNWEQFKNTQGKLNDSLGAMAPLLNALINAFSKIGSALIFKH
ncbi:DNA pilot protein [Sigmofec virus UA08Rod_6404]|uniref:DNA pilot protein n=1 Tax=Sigmofec virus UA08Rod_6404 TaxID=2929229 RepID=A0A976N1C8_9VIRU|nr:DNA pilot protein [Sigmofec virus UA08Rod_6404]